MTPLFPSPADLPAALRRPAGPVVFTLLDADPLPEWVHPDCLAPADVARLERTTHPTAREQFRRGRAVLRSALGLAISVPPAAVPLALTADGKPVLVGGGLHFNGSHTAGAAAFAFAPVPVGVDVERHSLTRDLPGLVRRYFTLEENEQFFAVPESVRAAAFLRGWTCKEAILKGIGCGVRGLAGVAVDLDPAAPPRALRTPQGEWELFTWEVADRIAGAVAVSGERGASTPWFGTAPGG